MIKYPMSEWAKLQDKRILNENENEIKLSKQLIKNAQTEIETCRKYIRELRKQSREILYRD